MLAPGCSGPSTGRERALLAVTTTPIRIWDNRVGAARPDTRAGGNPRCNSRTSVRYGVVYTHPEHARGSTSAHLSTDCPPPIHHPSTANPPTPAIYPPRPPRKSTGTSTVPICSGLQPNRTTTSCVLVLTDHGARRILRGSLD